MIHLQFQVAGQSYNPLQSDHHRAGQEVDAGYKQGTAQASRFGQNSRCPEELVVLIALILGQQAQHWAGLGRAWAKRLAR